MATYSRPAARSDTARWIATLDRLATAENALIALALTLAFVGLFVAADWLLKIPDAARLGTPAHQTADGVKELALAMGDAVRRRVMFVTLVLDSLFPLAYGGALAFGCGHLLRELDAPEPFRALRLLPLAAVAFDYLENLCILLLLGLHPHANVVAGPLVLFTRGKWLFLGASTAVFVIAGVWLGAQRVQAARRR